MDNANYDNSIWSAGTVSDPFSPPAAAASAGTRGSLYPGLDFYEDPFKNSNYRYADPFDSGDTSDPFFAKTTSEDDTFAAGPHANAGVVVDFDAAFGGGGDPFASSGGDPFSAAGSDPFSGAGSRTVGNSDPFAPMSGSVADPFSAAAAGVAKFDTSATDPFGNSFGGSAFSASQNNKLDSSFGVNSNAAFSNDPFSLTNLNNLTTTTSTSADLNAIHNNNNNNNGLTSSNSNSSRAATVSTTNSTLSYRKDPRLAGSLSASEKKKTSTSFADSLPRPGSSGAEAKPKKEKKAGRFHLGSPLKHISPKAAVGGGGMMRLGSDMSAEEVQMKMATEVNKRSEEERLRRLQLQEEQDLAYAIALSKAEAASLKQQ